MEPSAKELQMMLQYHLHSVFSSCHVIIIIIIIIVVLL